MGGLSYGSPLGCHVLSFGRSGGGIDLRTGRFVQHAEQVVKIEGFSEVYDVPAAAELIDPVARGGGDQDGRVFTYPRDENGS